MERLTLAATTHDSLSILDGAGSNGLNDSASNDELGLNSGQGDLAMAKRLVGSECTSSGKKTRRVCKA
jgi:hypothetical protein